MSEEVMYKLIDREGFIASSAYNRGLLEEAIFDEEFVKGTVTCEGNLDVGYFAGSILIEELENFFQEVVLTEPTLWDGKSPLEVGMVVKDHRGMEVVVEMLKGKQVVLRRYKEDDTLALSYIENIERAKLTHKEETFEKFLSHWHSQGLDYAFDSKTSTATLGEMFNIMYHVMNKENNNE